MAPFEYRPRAVKRPPKPLNEMTVIHFSKEIKVDMLLVRRAAKPPKSALL